MRSKIKQTLKTLGVSPGVKGYIYLVDIIERVVNDPHAINAVTRGVYRDVGAQHGTTATCVERCVRHAIESSCDTAAIDEINALFGNTIRADRGYPTGKQYIATVAEYIRDTLGGVAV